MTPEKSLFARGGKRAQRNRDESAACARPTFHQPSLTLPLWEQTLRAGEVSAGEATEQDAEAIWV